ncbi:MAG: Gfo/Idh/MocA family oxidoreductase [Verrucomicrobia bacterium]|nr:Gfo/Idh/MocA family oxidoreductase [Verrucomicrobiota bacterium]
MHTDLTTGRRNFIKLAGGAAAAIGFPTIIPSRVLGAAAPGKLIQIAQLGCGRIGFEMDMPGVLRQPGLARIIAVADFDSKRAALAKQHVEESYAKSLKQSVAVKAHQDYREILANREVDAVMISTPDHWHAQLVVEAALAGKDVYVQKPLSLTIGEGRLVSDVLKAKQAVFQIGSQQRSTAQFVRACQLVRNGAIGTVRTIKIGLPIDPAGGKPAEMPVPATFDYNSWLGATPQVYYTEDRCHPQQGFGRPGWLRLEQFGAGMITGWGSHHIDIAHWAMGTEDTGPIAVDAKASFPDKSSFWDVHGKYQVVLHYANGVTMTISDELPNGILFEGDNGWIWVSRGGAAATASDPTANQKASKAFNSSDPALERADLSGHQIQLHKSPQWNHHLDWLVAMRERKEAVTTAEAAHRTCSVCLMSSIGMKLGRPLKWDPQTEHFDDAAANQLLNRPERTPFGAFNAAKTAGFTHFKTI